MSFVKKFDIWTAPHPTDRTPMNVEVIHIHDVESGNYFPDNFDQVYYRYTNRENGVLYNMEHGEFVRTFTLHRRSKV